MAEYEHLRLVRVSEKLDRRKTGRFGGTRAERDHTLHGEALVEKLDRAVTATRRSRRPDAIDPALLLKVELAGLVTDEDWERAGFTVVSTNTDQTVLLFSSSDDLEEFRSRLNAYRGDIPDGQKNAPYANFIDSIEDIARLEPRDRIGTRLALDGFTSIDHFEPVEEIIVDIELWDIGPRGIREAKADEISTYIEGLNGFELDRYIGPSVTVLRVQVNGSTLSAILSIDEVASVDYPPKSDIPAAAILSLSLESFPTVEYVSEDDPVIGIIDSGVNDHPLLEGAIIEAFGSPSSLGSADDNGHGTRVAGIAVFGDITESLKQDSIRQGARICSAKVVNSSGDFDDRRIVSNQMRDSIERMCDSHGVRIFVISLGDRQFYYGDDNRVGSWAATLDELARERDVLIFVSAGNRSPRSGVNIETAFTEYPGYLFEPANRLFEPGGAANVVTVGSIASGSGLAENAPLELRPITQAYEPSPFTRVGPGASAISKPDLVDYGGTLVADTVRLRLSSGADYPSAGIITLHHEYADSLLSSGSGTSYAAPLAAHKASQLLKFLPNQPANLIRALLANAAEIPSAGRARFRDLDGDEQMIFGYGLANLRKARYSNDSRVVLYANDDLDLDKFAVYEITIPEDFQKTKGRRSIKVTLAFDPPVRHTRKDYLGVTMSYRLVRGRDVDFVFDHFRKRSSEEEDYPELPSRFNCKLTPTPSIRDGRTLQSSEAVFQQDISNYGNRYYLVVRCESRWAERLAQTQRFSVVVEIAHEAEISLYQRLRPRTRVRL